MLFRSEKTEKNIIENHRTKMADRNTKKKETMEIQNNQKTKDKMAVLSLHLSIIILNVNGLNSPIERQSGWMD